MMAFGLRAQTVSHESINVCPQTIDNFVEFIRKFIKFTQIQKKIMIMGKPDLSHFRVKTSSVKAPYRYWTYIIENT